MKGLGVVAIQENWDNFPNNLYNQQYTRYLHGWNEVSSYLLSVFVLVSSIDISSLDNI